MNDFLEDALILSFLLGLGLSFGWGLWLLLGPVGFSGLLLGYGVGLTLYFAPLPEG